MRIDFLLILLLQTKYHLHRSTSFGLYHYGLALEVQARLRSVLVDVCCDVFAAHLLLSNTILVYTKTCQYSSRPRVDLRTPIADHTDDDLLPRFLTPGFTVRPGAHMLNVLEYTGHGSCEKKVVFVVHCNNDEEFSVSWLRKKPLPQRKTLVVEIFRIASCRRISHVGKLISFWRFGVRYLTQ